MKRPASAVAVSDATLADLDALASLFEAYRAFYGRAPDAQAARAFVAARLEDRSTRFFVARLGGDGDIAGFVHLLPTTDTLAMRSAWILEDLFVDPAQRRKGVGSALLRHAEAFAKSSGAARLSLTTAHTNETAQRVYVEHGWVRDDVFRTYHRHV